MKRKAPPRDAHELRLRGCESLRQRLVLVTLSGRAVRIDDIRALDENPGLRDFEANLLRLLDKVTNGSSIRINQTGTTLWYRPGVVVGGELAHECSPSRSIGYYLEPLVCLAPFGKQPLSITLSGVTNDELDLCVDTFRQVTLPLLANFGIEGAELKVLKRGAGPLGGGEVMLSCPIVKELKPINITNPGLVKRVRGVAYCAKLSPQVANRMVDSARALLNKFLPDVYIFTDSSKGVAGGRSPGFGLSLVASSTERAVLLSAERAAAQGELPEDVGSAVARALCQEIESGGCVDSQHQSLMCILMALCPEDVSRLRVGRLAPRTMSTLRLLRQFLGVTFKLRSSEEETARVAAAAERVAAERERERRASEEAARRSAKKHRKRPAGERARGAAGEEKEEEAVPDEHAAAERPVPEEPAAAAGAPTVILSCLGVGFRNMARPSA